VRIQLRRSGGFAGLTRTAEVDSEELPEDEARHVHRLVEEGRLDELARLPPERPPGADRFQYELTVGDEGSERSLTVVHGAVPDDLRPLVDRLAKKL
jgi:emfourin